MWIDRGKFKNNETASFHRSMVSTLKKSSGLLLLLRMLLGARTTQTSPEPIRWDLGFICASSHVLCACVLEREREKKGALPAHLELFDASTRATWGVIWWNNGLLLLLMLFFRQFYYLPYYCRDDPSENQLHVWLNRSCAHRAQHKPAHVKVLSGYSGKNLWMISTHNLQIFMLHVALHIKKGLSS